MDMGPGKHRRITGRHRATETPRVGPRGYWPMASLCTLVLAFVVGGPAPDTYREYVSPVPAQGAEPTPGASTDGVRSPKSTGRPTKRPEVSAVETSGPGSGTPGSGETQAPDSQGQERLDTPTPAPPPTTPTPSSEPSSEPPTPTETTTPSSEPSSPDTELDNTPDCLLKDVLS